MFTAKRRLLVAIVLVLGGITAFGWFRIRAGTAQLTGEWKSWRSEFRISRADYGYRIVVNSPDGFLGGVYTGRLQHGALELEGPLAPLCGRMLYSRQDDALEFCGEQFQRAGK
jgi:hypothetical protein